jgi:acyl-homoserine lactone acylase PvdQ
MSGQNSSPTVSAPHRASAPHGARLPVSAPRRQGRRPAYSFQNARPTARAFYIPTEPNGAFVHCQAPPAAAAVSDPWRAARELAASWRAEFGTLGSNAVAIGSAGTRNHHGLLLGNPHYPWIGPERFTRPS